ncbi:MAG: hypothetical protein H7A09_01700 [Oceanospirillaceae bacterium]|nr:hypothetical protein [Oceanospirillaceae bacterium]MCP5334600.1 hypothetical protein [Oceanospirillaceae bacterium]
MKKLALHVLTASKKTTSAAASILCAGIFANAVHAAENNSEISLEYGQGNVELPFAINYSGKSTFQQEILGLNFQQNFAENWFGQLVLRDINSSADEYVANGNLWRVKEHEQQEANIIFGRYFALPQGIAMNPVIYLSGGVRYTDFSATITSIDSGTAVDYIVEDQKIGYIWQAGVQADLTARYQAQISPYFRRFEALNKTEQEWGLALNMHPVPAIKLGLAYENSPSHASEAVLFELSALFGN